MTARNPARRHTYEGDPPDRAVIDIGSNTVRLVVYSGSRRVPDVWLNEKVTAKLGRDLASTGRMPDKAIELAMGGLARFAAVLEDIGIRDVQVVATAAVRDAENGPDFLAQARLLGLEPRLLSGEEEAQMAAYGVIGAFPGARGVVADLGGGSLELVGIAEGKCGDGVSLPLGTLRLPALREKGDAAFRKAVAGELKAADWAAAHPGPLYLVGGTWRAMANYIMHRDKHPLSDPHGLVVPAEEADKLAKKLMRADPDQLSSISGINSSRAAGLPDAAAMLRVVLAELQPDALMFSSWGLREGLLFSALPQPARDQDPLLAAVTHFTAPRGASPTIAAMIAGWTADVAQGQGNGSERLRLAATMLAQAAARIEPNMRLGHALDWALHKRWLGIDHRARVMLGSAIRAACGKPEIVEEWKAVASEADLREAGAWGLAIRLCRRIGAGSRLSLMTSALQRQDDKLILWLDESRAQLASDSVRGDLKELANWLDCDHELRVADLAMQPVG